jgi:hypothetical protein
MAFVFISEILPFSEKSYQYHRKKFRNVKRNFCLRGKVFPVFVILIWKSLRLQGLPYPHPSRLRRATFPPGKVSDPAKFDGLACGAMWASPPTKAEIYNAPIFNDRNP